MSHIVHFTDANFASEVEASDKPVLVEFWASWCPPCQMMVPMLKKVASTYADQLKVGKINVDQNPRTAEQYTVQGMPTFLLVNGGDVKGRRVGAQSFGQIKALIEETQILTAQSDGAADDADEGDGGDEEDEEKILEHLRALGYVD